MGSIFSSGWIRQATAAAAQRRVALSGSLPAERTGLIRSRWEPAQPGRRGPRRRVYELTRKGSRQLASGREAWVQFVGIVGGILGVQA